MCVQTGKKYIFIYFERSLRPCWSAAFMYRTETHKWMPNRTYLPRIKFACNMQGGSGGDVCACGSIRNTFLCCYCRSRKRDREREWEKKQIPSARYCQSIFAKWIEKKAEEEKMAYESFPASAWVTAAAAEPENQCGHQPFCPDETMVKDEMEKKWK